jgi:hypothetical protein
VALVSVESSLLLDCIVEKTAVGATLAPQTATAVLTDEFKLKLYIN